MRINNSLLRQLAQQSEWVTPRRIELFRSGESRNDDFLHNVVRLKPRL